MNSAGLPHAKARRGAQQDACLMHLSRPPEAAWHRNSRRAVPPLALRPVEGNP